MYLPINIKPHRKSVPTSESMSPKENLQDALASRSIIIVIPVRTRSVERVSLLPTLSPYIRKATVDVTKGWAIKGITAPAMVVCSKELIQK